MIEIHTHIILSQGEDCMIEQCDPKFLSMLDFDCETFESIAIACGMSMRPALKGCNHLVFGDGYFFGMLLVY